VKLSLTANLKTCQYAASTVCQVNNFVNNSCNMANVSCPWCRFSSSRYSWL